MFRISCVLVTQSRAKIHQVAVFIGEFVKSKFQKIFL